MEKLSKWFKIYKNPLAVELITFLDRAGYKIVNAKNYNEMVTFCAVHNACGCSFEKDDNGELKI